MLKGGNIVEQGNHNELLSRPDGAYATLLKLQMTAQKQAGPDAKQAGAPQDAIAADDDIKIVPAAEQVPAVVSCHTKGTLRIMYGLRNLLDKWPAISESDSQAHVGD